jgi:hypothetical protein
LFEIMSTLNVQGATLDVALSADERERFVDTLGRAPRIDPGFSQ